MTRLQSVVPMAMLSPPSACTVVGSRSGSGHHGQGAAPVEAQPGVPSTLQLQPALQQTSEVQEPLTASQGPADALTRPLL